MNGLPYYKAYPRDFVEGTIGMPFEVKCAYRVVIDLIYMQGGRLPDDARYISGHLGCTVRKWNSIRSELVALGKLRVIDGFLANYRADNEIETLRKLQDKQAENARAPRKNKGLEKPRLHHTEPEPEPYKDTTLLSVRAARDAPAIPDDLTKQLCQAAGITENELCRSPGLLTISEPYRWLVVEGCDLELDVLPVLRSRQKPGVRSWSYWDKAVLEARDKRLAPPTPVQSRAADPPRRQRETVTTQLTDWVFQGSTHDPNSQNGPSHDVQRLPSGRAS